MDSLVLFLQNQGESALKKVLEGQDCAAYLPLEITQTTQSEFGHYQCNSAMKLAKALKQSPRGIAEKLAQEWKEFGGESVEKIEVAGPGFINLTLSYPFLSKRLSVIGQNPRLGVDLASKKKKVIVEFSSPNVAKELHVGHLRSTIIGESLARLLEFLGHSVLRLNHIGDWGTQFGMLITYLYEFEPEVVLSNKKKASLSTLMYWYRESKKMFDADLDFKNRAQLCVVKLQGGDPDVLKVWERICEISRQGFQEIYDFLDVSIEERGESSYNPMLSGVVQDFECKGLVTVSDGAKCVFLEGFRSQDNTDLPLILQKSDGGYNYSTIDLAALKQRTAEEKAERIIYVVDAGQQLHFQMVFAAARRVGYYDGKCIEIAHVPFGVVLGPDGKKFKTRSGQTEKLIDLLQEAVARAQVLLKERNPDLPEKEIEDLAHILGVGAVKYADLSCHRVKDYIFSYDRMLKFEGNTAAYLLYSYVRIEGIKRRAGKDVDAILATTPITMEEETERQLGLKVLQFGEALEAMDRDLLPNRLCDYLYELAEKFHAFFRDCRVEGNPKESSRLALCELTARVMAKGLHILGLKTMSRM